jgi:DUF438 domain-containing protein
MGEYIDNQTRRRETLKRLIRQLHEGWTVEDVKDEFAALLDDVGATEIAEIEQALIAVRFFSQTRERIFPRSPAIIGRKVQQCHPPASVHRVQGILDDFRAGRRDQAEFWIQMQRKFIHIRYFAVRDERGEYQGTIEVSQDLTRIRTLEGERRLLDEGGE